MRAEQIRLAGLQMCTTERETATTQTNHFSKEQNERLSQFIPRLPPPTFLSA